MTEQPHSQTRAVARGLTDALNSLTARLDEVKQASEDRDDYLRKYGRRNRKLVLVHIIATVIATAATTIALLGLSKAHDAAAAAAQNRQAAIVSCRMTNVARAESVQLWDHLIAISQPPPGENAAQKARRVKELAGIRAYVASIYAPRDCVAIARGQKP